MRLHVVNQVHSGLLGARLFSRIRLLVSVASRLTVSPRFLSGQNHRTVRKSRILEQGQKSERTPGTNLEAPGSQDGFSFRQQSWTCAVVSLPVWVDVDLDLGGPQGRHVAASRQSRFRGSPHGLRLRALPFAARSGVGDGAREASGVRPSRAPVAGHRTPGLGPSLRALPARDEVAKIDHECQSSWRSRPRRDFTGICVFSIDRRRIRKTEGASKTR